jgi:hypothetical protein
MELHAIEPITWQRNKAQVTQIRVCLCYDDLKTGATFQVDLFSAGGFSIDTVQVPCLANDYAGWDGNNSFPLQHVLTQLQFELKKTI